MFGTKSKSAPSGERFHVVVSDNLFAYSLAGALPHDEAIGMFAERVGRCGYPPDGPVRLRVIGEREFAALEIEPDAASVATALLES